MGRHVAAVIVVALLAVAATPVAAMEEPSDWAPVTTATIHPGVQTVTDGGQCTANFVFSDGTDVYLGQAAHCGSPDAATATNGCSATPAPLDTPVEIQGADHPGRLAYTSWEAMRQRGEQRDSVCRFNDFALVRVDPRDHDRVNPSVPHYGGPTGLARSVASGTAVYSYGNSSLRLGLRLLSPKQGLVFMTSGDGWNHEAYFATPGIPGDSGSGVVDSLGRAAGTLTTVAVAPFPASNGLTSLGLALDYLAESEGPDVTLVKGTAGFAPGLPLHLDFGDGPFAGDPGDDPGGDPDDGGVEATRVWGSDRYETANAVARGTAAADTVVIAVGGDFADALAAGPVAAELGVPLLLSTPAGLTASTRAEIDRLGARSAVIVGGTRAVPGNVEDQLAAMGVTAERVAGDDRFETAVAVADRFFDPGTPVVVASGQRFPDALAATPFAAATGAPLVLVGTDTVPAPTDELLQRWDPSAVTIVGGTAAVSGRAADRVEASSGRQAQRIAGEDRFETAARLAEELFASSSYGFGGVVWAASGIDFADALAGGPATFVERGVLLLVPPTGVLPGTVAEVAEASDATALRVLGGTAAVSDDMARQLLAALER